MKKVALEKAWKIVNFFKGHPNVEVLFVNEAGDYQLQETDGFKSKVTREDAEKAAENLPQLEEKKAVAAEPNEEQQKVNEELVANNNDLKEKNDKLAIENEEYKAQIGDLVEGETEEDLNPRGGSWLAERRNWTKVYDEVKDQNAALEKKVADLEEKLAAASKKGSGK